MLAPILIGMTILATGSTTSRSATDHERLTRFSLETEAVISPSPLQERTRRTAGDFIDQMWAERAGQVALFRYADGDTTTDRLSAGRASTTGCESTFFATNRAGHSDFIALDWAKVSQIEVSDGNDSYIRVYGGQTTHRMVGFALPSRTDASRVETAMKFLQTDCAPASAF